MPSGRTSAASSWSSSVVKSPRCLALFGARMRLRKDTPFLSTGTESAGTLCYRYWGHDDTGAVCNRAYFFSLLVLGTLPSVHWRCTICFGSPAGSLAGTGATLVGFGSTGERCLCDMDGCVAARLRLYDKRQFLVLKRLLPLLYEPVGVARCVPWPPALDQHLRRHASQARRSFEPARRCSGTSAS